MLEPRLSRVVHVDLANGLPDLSSEDAEQDVLAILWLGDIPLGQLELNHLGLSPRALADKIAHTVARSVGDRIFGEGFRGFDGGAGLPLPPEAPSLGAVAELKRPLSSLQSAVEADRAPNALTVSVVVCTRDRPADLERCLASLSRSTRSWAELIVVDNGPSAATRAVVERYGFARYLAEPRRGLSAARNAGIAAARGEVVAFVDDDTEVHPRWLERLREGFDAPDVMCVTGLVLPAELATMGQVTFEKILGGFGRGYHHLIYGRDFFARTHGQGAPVWKVGAGANMALRAQAFKLVGGFDERLGAGAAGCSEDSELWYRLLSRGWKCRYVPDSAVHHHHRRDMADLEDQAHEYIRGHVAALFVQFARHGHRGTLWRAFIGMPRHLLVGVLKESVQRLLVRIGFLPPLLRTPALPQAAGYLRGLCFAPLIGTRRRHKPRLGAFLRRNPFPRPLTEGFFYREKMRAIHRVSPELPLREILEVGGGQSGMARMLYPSAHVTTVDMDARFADSPVNQGAQVTFVNADATALPFPDASFDAVTFFDVLEHVPDDSAAAREALRVLRPGGWIMVSSPNLNWRSPYHRIMRPICPDDREMMDRWAHVRRGYDAEGLERLFGGPADRRADFINPITVIGHDVAFSHLPARIRRRACVALSPLTWFGYMLQTRLDRGTETAASWRKPGP